MFLYRRESKSLAIYSYIVGDEGTKRCAVIDPIRDVDEYIEVAKNNHLTITDIMETHVHADFLSGALELKERLEGKPVIHCSSMGGALWTPRYCDHPTQEGERITLGAIELEAIHTPGHTPEHVMWALYDTTRSRDTPWLLFSGDFLFVGSVGRPDLLGSVAMKHLSEELYQSLFTKITALPDFVELFPAHGAGSLCGKAIGTRNSTTLGFERRYNPSMKELPKAIWIEELMKGMAKAPPYFSRMKRINVEGPPKLPDMKKPLQKISSGDLKQMIEKEGALLLDLRDQHRFAKKHLAGSINIPYGGMVVKWAGWFLPDDRPIILIAEKEDECSHIRKELSLIGIDMIVGIVDGEAESWEKRGYPTSSFSLWSVKKLSNALSNDKNLLLIDVRSEKEWREGSINQSQNIPIDTFPDILKGKADEWKGSQIAFICRTGYRASIAASLAKKHGYSDVINVEGGMVAWQNELDEK